MHTASPRTIFIAVTYLHHGLHLDAGRVYAYSRSWTLVDPFSSDNVGGVRTLSAAAYTDTANMTIESCINFCSTGSNAYVYAGVEYAQECCMSHLIQ